MRFSDCALTSPDSRRWNWEAFVALAISLTGCGVNAPCAVKGIVQVNGAPASGVYVILNNSNREPAGTGRTDKDGVFRLTVEKAGDYSVTCFMPKVTTSMEDYFEGEDIFQGRHRDPNKPVTKVNIKSGENELSLIELR